MIDIRDHGGVFGGSGIDSSGRTLIKVYVSETQPSSTNIGDVWIQDSPTVGYQTKILDNVQQDPIVGDYFIGVGGHAFKVDIAKPMKMVGNPTTIIYVDVKTNKLVNESGYISSRIDVWTNTLQTLLVRLDVAKKYTSDGWKFHKAMYYTGTEWRVFSPSQYKVYVQYSQSLTPIDGGIVGTTINHVQNTPFNRVVIDHKGFLYKITGQSGSTYGHAIIKFKPDGTIVARIDLVNVSGVITFTNTTFNQYCLNIEDERLYVSTTYGGFPLLVFPLDLSYYKKVTFVGSTPVIPGNSNYIYLAMSVVDGKIKFSGSTNGANLTIESWTITSEDTLTFDYRQSVGSGQSATTSGFTIGDTHFFTQPVMVTKWVSSSTQPINKSNMTNTMIMYYSPNKIAAFRYSNNPPNIEIYDYDLNLLDSVVLKGKTIPAISGVNNEKAIAVDKDGAFYYMTNESTKKITKVTKDFEVAWSIAVPGVPGPDNIIIDFPAFKDYPQGWQ